MPQAATANFLETPSPDLELEAPAAPVSQMRVGSFNPRHGDDKLEVINIRRAARLNASSINQAEIDHLLKERADLIDKKFSSDFSHADGRRLAFVRWSLDRIQDAKHGEALDQLEAAVARYENFSNEIQSLIAQLENVSGTKISR